MKTTSRRSGEAAVCASETELSRVADEVLADYGRFLEIGKRDIYQNSRIPLWPLRRNASNADRPSSSIAGAMSAQRTASQIAIGIRTTEPARSKTATTAIISATAAARAGSADRCWPRAG